MKDTFYLVENILDHDGHGKQDGRAHQTIGRIVCISARDGVKVGRPCYLWYFTDWEGNEVHHFCHKTSDVEHYDRYGNTLVITTEKSVYKLREVEEWESHT